MLKKIERCPICSSRRLIPFRKGRFSAADISPERIRITDAEYGLTWSLSRCLDCYYIFANPCPEAEFLSSVYREVVDPAYEEEAAGRRYNFRRILRRLSRFAPQKGWLFDVGAATGLFLDEAKQKGWRVSGVEVSQWAVDQAREKYGIHLYQGSFETLALGQEFYDAVTLIDILEHTPNPKEIAEKAYQILKTGGIIVVVTPDFDSLTAHLAGRRWWHFRPGHLGYFNRQSLRKILELTGFSILSWKRYSWTFSLAYLFSRQKIFWPLQNLPALSSLWPKIQLKLALGDSFEVYARKKEKV